jgi:hypothetical protein
MTEGRHRNHADPTYFSHVKVNTGQQIVPDVPCKIYVPDRVDGDIRIVLSPSDLQAQRLRGVHKISFTADIGQTVIESKISYVIQQSRSSWGPYSPGTTVECEPRDLRIIRSLSDRSEPGRTAITFWITRNRLLTPGVMRTSSLDGSVEVERGVQIAISASKDLVMTFDVEYHEAHERDTIVQWPQLVARSNCDLPAEAVDRISRDVLPILDDVLLLTSLAARQRTVCMGWVAADDRSITTFYRREMSIPEEPSIADDELVKRMHADEFLSVAYAKFSQLRDNQAVRRAIWAAVPAHTNIFDESYLAHFSGLEGLLSTFRRHVSARVAFEKFCEQYGVNVSDLWPLFSDAGGLGLASIRNKLIHGEGYRLEHFRGLLIAKQYLHWTLERMLLAILGWPLEKSYVSPEILDTVFEPHNEWRSARQDLTAAFQE